MLVIPAAGTGSRLGATVPKLLVPVNGRPMIDHLLTLYAGIAGRGVVVLAPSAVPLVADRFAAALLPLTIVVQAQPTGMLDAILLAREPVAAAQPRRVLITWCDQVAVLPSTISKVADAARSSPQPDLVLPTCGSEHPYVHLVRDADGRVCQVLHRREGDRMPLVGESDAGVFDLSLHCYLDWLPRYARVPDIGARTGERNFVPFVAWVARRGSVVTVPCTEREEAVGINTPDELSMVEARLRMRQGL